MVLINFGFVKKLYAEEWIQDDIPEPFGTTIEQLTNILATDIYMEFKSIPPHFGKHIFEPTKHAVQVKAKFIDPDYTVWNEDYKPEAIQYKEIKEQAYERYRATKIAEEDEWDTKNKFLYTETPTTKIFVTKELRNQGIHHRNFDIFHPKPSLIQSYKKERQRKKNNEDKDDVESTTMSTDD